MAAVKKASESGSKISGIIRVPIKLLKTPNNPFSLFLKHQPATGVGATESIARAKNIWENELSADDKAEWNMKFLARCYQVQTLMKSIVRRSSGNSRLKFCLDRNSPFHLYLRDESFKLQQKRAASADSYDSSIRNELYKTWNSNKTELEPKYQQLIQKLEDQDFDKEAFKSLKPKSIRPKRPMNPPSKYTFSKFHDQESSGSNSGNFIQSNAQTIKALMQEYRDSLSDSEKKPYIDAYQKEMAEYRSAIHEYRMNLTLTDAMIDAHKKTRKYAKQFEIALGKPKAPANAFVKYVLEKWSDFDGGDIVASGDSDGRGRGGLTSRLAKEWREMSDEEKRPYQGAYEQEKKEFQQAKDEFEKRIAKYLGNDSSDFDKLLKIEKY